MKLFIPAKQRAKRELARMWRMPRGSNTPPLWGELAKKKLSHAPLLVAGYLTVIAFIVYGCFRFNIGVGFVEADRIICFTKLVLKAKEIDSGGQ